MFVINTTIVAQPWIRMVVIVGFDRVVLLSGVLPFFFFQSHQKLVDGIQASLLGCPYYVLSQAEYL